MFFLTKQNKFRLFFIVLVENTWFERLVSLNIILCTVVLFFYTYADLLCPETLPVAERETCLLKNEAGINRDKILNKIFFYFFNLIFLLEMLCNIIAKGFLLHKRAYMRSFWNAIDCFATVYSLLEIIYPFLGKMVILRVIRLLRIIKNIKTLESIKKPINCIMLAIPTIANVLLFLGFIFTVFATLGIQLFSGAFFKRCREAPVDFFADAADKALKFRADPVTPFLCNEEGFYGRCPQGTYCVGFYDIPSFFNLTERNITIDLFDIQRENLNTNFFLFYAIPNFDTIINCFVNVFVIMTYQNWTDISSIIIDSHSGLMVNLYFNIIVIFGGFFIMKMIFAAQNEVFIKVKEDEQENKLLMLQNFSTANPQIAGFVDIDKLLQNINSMESIELFKKIEKVIVENQMMMNTVGKKDFENFKKDNKNDVNAQGNWNTNFNISSSNDNNNVGGSRDFNKNEFIYEGLNSKAVNYANDQKREMDLFVGNNNNDNIYDNYFKNENDEYKEINASNKMNNKIENLPNNPMSNVYQKNNQWSNDPNFKMETKVENEEIKELEDFNLIKNKTKENESTIKEGKNTINNNNKNKTIAEKPSNTSSNRSQNPNEKSNKSEESNLITDKKIKQTNKKQKLATTKDKLYFNFNNIEENFLPFNNRKRRSSLDFLNTKIIECAMKINKNNNKNNKDFSNKGILDKNFNKANDEKKDKYSAIISRKSSDKENVNLITNEENNYNYKNIYYENNENENYKAKNKSRNHIVDFIYDFENLNEFNEINNYDKNICEHFSNKDLKENLSQHFNVKVNDEIEFSDKQNFSLNESDSPFDFFPINKDSIKENDSETNRNTNRNNQNTISDLQFVKESETKNLKKKSKSNPLIKSNEAFIEPNSASKQKFLIENTNFKEKKFKINLDFYPMSDKEKFRLNLTNQENNLFENKQKNDEEIKDKKKINYSKSLIQPLNKTYTFKSSIKSGEKKENEDSADNDLEEIKAAYCAKKKTVQSSKFAKINNNKELAETENNRSNNKRNDDNFFGENQNQNEAHLNLHDNNDYQNAYHFALETKFSTNEKTCNSRKNLNKQNTVSTLIMNNLNLLGNNSNSNNDSNPADRNNSLISPEEANKLNLISKTKKDKNRKFNNENSKNFISTSANENIKYSLGYRENNNFQLNNFYPATYNNSNNNNNNNNNNNIINRKSNVSNISSNSNNLSNEGKRSKNNFLVEKLQEYKDNIINKLKLLILEQHSKTPHYIIFNSIIFFVNLINFIFLLTIHHQMELAEVNRIVLINMVCSGIFVIEIIFKILVLGRSYFKDLMNVLDLVVILAGIAEIAVTNYNLDPYDDANSDIIALRAIRFLRILKLFTKKSYLGRFLNFINQSLHDLFIFTILLGFFIVIFALAGREFFTNRIRMHQRPDSFNFIFPEEISPRENFDTIVDSFITVFILFIGDNWGRLMYQYATIDKQNSYLFFILIIICGNIMLFNLFLSILISNYEAEFSNFLEDAEDNEEEDLIDENVQRVKKMYTQVFSHASKAVNKITNKLCCCFRKRSSDDSTDKSFENPIDQSENKSLRKIEQEEVSAIAVHRRAGKISDSLRNFKMTQQEIKSFKNKNSELSANETSAKNNNNNNINHESNLSVNNNKNNAMNKSINNKNKNSKKSKDNKLNLIKNFFGGYESFTPEDLKDIIPMIGKSLWIFPKSSPFRRKIWLIVTRSQAYEYFNMVCIMLSLFVLAIDDSFLRDKSLIKMLFYLDCFTNFTFLIEFLLKIISFGLIFNGIYSYLRNYLNVLDLGSLVVSIIYIIINSYQVFEETSLILTQSELNSLNISEEEKQSKKTVTKIFQIIKMLRLLRLMKLIEKSKFLQAASRTIIKSLKQTLVIILIGSGFILMFSVAAITYFRGLFFRCDFSTIPKQFMYQVSSKWECLDYGGVWVNPYPNFDNTKNAFILLFEMMTTENWVFYMHLGIDSTQIDAQPIRDNNYAYVLYFIFYMIFAYFFMLNLSISILFKNFKSEKADMQDSYFKLPLQKEFFKIFEKLYKLIIPVKKQKPNKLTKVLLNILDSIYFDVVITVCIVANLVTLMMNTPGMDQQTLGFIGFMNTIFNWVFIFEAVLKIYVYRCEYFTNPWNIIDFIIVTDNLVNLLLKSFIDLFSRVFDTSILRAIRVARILRLLKKAKTLNKIFNLFLNSIQPMVSIGILYAMLLFFYAIVGMSVFQYVKHQEIISPKWNFENFSNAFLLLIRITSGESWNVIMHECARGRSLNFFYGNIGCGSIFAIPYFFSFVIISNMLFVQFFSVIIATTIIDTYSINLEPPKKAHLDKFMNNWIKYDKEKTGFMKVELLQKFLFQIGFPFGLSTMKPSEYTKLINVLDIPTYEKQQYVFFYDCIVELTKYSMITNTISEEFKTQKLFKNQEKITQEKSKMFESINSEIAEMKNHIVMKNLNPYNKQEKYGDYQIDKVMHSISFKQGDSILLNYAWGIKSISKFIRLYNFTRARCLKILQGDCFSDENLVDYANMYFEHLNFLKLKTIYNNANTSHISEEDENSQLEMTVREAENSEAGETDPKNQNLIKPTSQENSKLNNSSSSSVLSKGNRSLKSNSKSSSKDCDIKFINKNNYKDKNKGSTNKNLSSKLSVNQESSNILFNASAEKESESILNCINNSKNNNEKDSDLLMSNGSNLNIPKTNINNSFNINYKFETNNILLKKQKTYIKDLIDGQTFKTFSSHNIPNVLSSNNFSNESKKSKEVPTNNTSRTLADLMAIPKITVKKKIDEKKELKAEIQMLRSNNQEFNNRRKFKESAKQRKITQFNKDSLNNFNNVNNNYSGYLDNNNGNNSYANRSNFEEEEDSYVNNRSNAFDQSVEIINNEGGKTLKILERLKNKSNIPQLEEEISAENSGNSFPSNHSNSEDSIIQGKASKEKYMNSRNINFNCNSGNLIIINEKSEETINDKNDKNNSLIYNDNNDNIKSNNSRQNTNNNNSRNNINNSKIFNNSKNYEEFQSLEDENERKLYILNALKKNLELQNEKTKEEDDNVNILQNFNKIIEIKNKEELLKNKSTK